MQPREFDKPESRPAYFPMGRGRAVLAGLMFLLAIVARFSGLEDERADPALRSTPVAVRTEPTQSAIPGRPAPLVDHATRRIKLLGDQLLRRLPPSTVRNIRFQVLDPSSEARSWSDPQGVVVLTKTLVDALPEDAWLATILSYEIGLWLQGQLPEPAADIDDFVIALMRSAGFDPQVVADMSEWVVTSTSLRPAVVTDQVVADFSRRIARRIAQTSPSQNQ